MNIFKSITTRVTHFFSWLTSKNKSISELSADAKSAPLLHRALIPQSSFDKLCATWAEQSIIIKVSALAFVTLSFGLIGLFAGVPTLLALTSLMCSIGVHIFLVAHNTKRIHHAERTIKDTMSEGIAAQVCDEVSQQVHHFMSEELSATQKTSEIIERQSNEVNKVTCELVTQHDEVVDAMEQVKEQGLGLNHVLQETVLQAEHFSSAVGTFSALVDDLQEGQKIYSHAAHTLAQLVIVATQNHNEHKHNELAGLGNQPKDKPSLHGSLINESIATLPIRVAQYKKDLDLFDDVLREKKERLDMEQEELAVIEARIKSRAQDVSLSEHLKKQAQDLVEHTQFIEQYESQITNLVEESRSFDEAWLLRIDARTKDGTLLDAAQEIVEQGISLRMHIEQKNGEESKQEELSIDALNARLSAVRARRMARAQSNNDAVDGLTMRARQLWGFNFNGAEDNNEGKGLEEESMFLKQ